MTWETPRLTGTLLRLWCCLWLLGLPARTAVARSPGTDDPETPFVPTAADSAGVPSERPDCFPGIPGPDCPQFVLSELSTGKRLGDLPPGVEDDYLMINLGYMKKICTRSAWGVSASLTWSEDTRYGIHGHYRRWLGRHFSLDFSPGVWASGESMFDNRFDHFGLSARTDLMFEETFGVGVELDSGNPVNQKAGTEWKTAFRAGGYASLVAAGVLAVIGLMYAIALNDPNY